MGEKDKDQREGPRETAFTGCFRPNLVGNDGQIQGPNRAFPMQQSRAKGSVDRLARLRGFAWQRTINRKHFLVTGILYIHPAYSGV